MAKGQYLFKLGHGPVVIVFSNPDQRAYLRTPYDDAPVLLRDGRHCAFRNVDDARSFCRDHEVDVSDVEYRGRKPDYNWPPDDVRGLGV